MKGGDILDFQKGGGSQKKGVDVEKGGMDLEGVTHFKKSQTARIKCKLFLVEFEIKT